MIDLMTPVQKAFFQALKSGVTLATVYDVVPQGVKPPFVMLGEITLDPQGEKGAQYDRFEVEVHSIYSGKDRTKLIAIQSEAIAVITAASLGSAEVEITDPQLIGASVSTAGSDGVTYAGISTFEVFAEPA